MEGKNTISEGPAYALSRAGATVTPAPGAASDRAARGLKLRIVQTNMAGDNVHIKQIPLSGPPNNIAISKDGRRLYQAIHGEPFGVDGHRHRDAGECQEVPVGRPCGSPTGGTTRFMRTRCPI